MDDIEILPEDYKENDLTFKMIIIGDSGTGKSCFSDRANKKDFEEARNNTVGFEFFIFNIRINEKVIKLQIWDTCGGELYKSFISTFCRNSSLGIIVYSIDDKSSFKNIENWLKFLKAQNPDIKIFLVGNKSDLEEYRKVSKDEGENFAKENKLDMFFETSAKSDYNVQKVFIEAAKLLYSQYIESQNEIKKKEEKEEEDNEEKEDEENDLTIEEYKKGKCSLNEHKENDAISFCPECTIFMCNKCEKIHSGLCQNHHPYNLNNMDEEFIGICKENNHFLKLDFFCVTHNQLCCPACITKIKIKKYGKHKDCQICSIKKIKNEKKIKLEENIQKLEDLSKKIEQTINDLKAMLRIIDNNKEELKTKIQEIFTKMRNMLNIREDELLLEVDKKFDELFLDEKIVKKSENLPQEIKIYLEKGKKINNEWENKEKLTSIINDCINIENTINNINNINDNIKNFKEKKNYVIKLKPNEEELEECLNGIKEIGEIYCDEKEENKENSKEKNNENSKEENKENFKEKNIENSKGKNKKKKKKKLEDYL